jgi:hypothetical protein
MHSCADREKVRILLSLLVPPATTTLSVKCGFSADRCCLTKAGQGVNADMAENRLNPGGTELWAASKRQRARTRKARELRCFVWCRRCILRPVMKVFLSSTAQDLVAHRRVADDTILRLSQEAVVMERFGPLPGEPVAECERKARGCDVVLCIVAHRYGYVPEKGRGSITRREVEAAHAAGKQGDP